MPLLILGREEERERERDRETEGQRERNTDAREKHPLLAYRTCPD